MPGRKRRIEDQDLSPAMSEKIKAVKSKIDQSLRRLIREGVADGSIRSCDVKMTAFALAGALNRIAHWHRADDSRHAAFEPRPGTARGGPAPTSAGPPELSGPSCDVRPGSCR